MKRNNSREVVINIIRNHGVDVQDEGDMRYEDEDTVH